MNSPVQAQCPKCSALNDGSPAFCPQCGTKLSPDLPAAEHTLAAAGHRAGGIAAGGRSRWIALGAGVVLLVVIVGVVVLRPWQQPASADGLESVELPQADVSAIEAGIVSQDIAAVSAVLIPEARESFGQQGQPLLPTSSALSIDAGSAQGFQDFVALVNATVTGPQAGTYSLELNYTGGHWLVASAIPST